MEELMYFIKTVFEQAWKENDDECRYNKFATGLSEKKISLGVLEELLQEIQEEYNYKETYFVKIFKPAIIYIAAPVYATFIANWVQNAIPKENDFWFSLILVTVIFAIGYAAIGGIIYAFFVTFDRKNRKHKSLVRWMQKYIRSRKIKKMLHKK